ncbi:MAG: hypothetical protein Q7K29_04925 [Thermoleophilia bacterium]|nr:hypothetical protein [Thermoleophilia bacterium]
MNKDNDLKPPSKTKGDVAHTLVKSGLSAIPIVGGPASELFAAIVMPPLERRRITWMEEVGQELKRLHEEKGIDLESLRENEEFIDIVMAASTAALKTANKEKRLALKNAIINVASGQSPEESQAQVFISFVDQFTEWHLKILMLFQDPKAWAEARKHDFGSLYSSSLATTLTSAYPELAERRSFYDQIWRDLRQRGLVSTDSLAGMVTADGALQKYTTDLGDAFLAFIALA